MKNILNFTKCYLIEKLLERFFIYFNNILVLDLNRNPYPAISIVFFDGHILINAVLV